MIRGRLRALAVAGAALACAAGLLVSVPASAAVPTPPVPPNLPEQVEPLAGYQGQAICDLSARPGTQAFIDLIRATYGEDEDVWAPRDCAQGGRSEHKEGRAIDWMLDVTKPSEAARAAKFLTWLLATDEAGNAFAMARRLGVMYVGWNNCIWESYTALAGSTNTPGCRKQAGWSALYNYAVGAPCSQTPQPQYSTAPCHRDHIHISLSWDGAAGLTSFWGADPEPVPFCPRWTNTSATPRVTVRGLDYRPVEPTRVFDSAQGIDGSLDPCRLSQLPAPALAQATDGSRREYLPGQVGPAVFVPVIGVGEVPNADIRAAMVRIRAVGPNAPTSVFAWPSGGSIPAHPVLTTRLRATASADTVVAVASDGTIALAVDSGSSVVTVDVLGYFVRPASSTADGPSGPLTAQAPTLAYTTRGSAGGALGPRETRLVTIAGHGGLPSADAPTPMGAAWLTVTTAASRTSGAVRIAPRIDAPGAQSVPVRRLEPVTSALVTTVDDRGRIAITNTTARPLHVDIVASGWSARGAAAGEILKPVLPVPVLDTATGLGVVPDAVPTSNGMRVRGVGGVPRTATSVAVQVSLTAGAGPAIVRMWPGGSVASVPPTLSAPAGALRTGLVILPLSEAGGLRWLLSDRAGRELTDAAVSVRVVGHFTRPTTVPAASAIVAAS